MHCSANVGKDGDAAIFFGLSGTGQDDALAPTPRAASSATTSTAGAPNGVFNFEDGCYAKVIRLSPEAEPQIFATTRRFGTILENVVYDPVSRLLDLNDEKLTENTRGAYPLDFIDERGARQAGRPPEERRLPDLRRDRASCPPSRGSSPEQAIYHFISGYTSKIAGTEIGLGIEPEITFSACFGGPFMVHHPYVYADLLRKKMLQHGATCWLVNTGWTGGPVRHRQADQHRPHAQAPERGAHRGARQGALPQGPGLRLRRARELRGRPDRDPRAREHLGQPRGVLQEVRRPRRPLHRELQADGGRLPARRRRARPEAADRRARPGRFVVPLRGRAIL